MIFKQTITYEDEKQKKLNKDTAFFTDKGEMERAKEIAMAILKTCGMNIIKIEQVEGYFFSEKSIDKLRKNI